MPDEYKKPTLVNDDSEQPTTKVVPIFAAGVLIIAYAAVVWSVGIGLNYAGVINAGVSMNVGINYAVEVNDC